MAKVYPSILREAPASPTLRESGGQYGAAGNRVGIVTLTFIAGSMCCSAWMKTRWTWPPTITLGQCSIEDTAYDVGQTCVWKATSPARYRPSS